MEKIREEVMRMIWEAQEKAKNSKNPIGIHKGIYADKIIGLLKRHFSTDLSGFIVEEKCEHEEGVFGPCSKCDNTGTTTRPAEMGDIDLLCESPK